MTSENISGTLLRIPNECLNIVRHKYWKTWYPGHRSAS